MTQFKTIYVSPGALDQKWPIAGPLIDLAVRRLSSKMDLEDVKADIESGAQQLWLVSKDGDTVAAITTILEFHPKCKVLRIMLLGGRDMRLWLHDALHVIKDAAQRLGCKTIEADGRLGWVKHAPKCGFKEIARTYELEI